MAGECRNPSVDHQRHAGGVRLSRSWNPRHVVRKLSRSSFGSEVGASSQQTPVESCSFGCALHHLLPKALGASQPSPQACFGRYAPCNPLPTFRSCPTSGVRLTQLLAAP